MYTSVTASTFLKTKIVDRMKNTDGAVFGQYVGHSYKKIPSGDVVTEHVFSVEKVAGLAPNDILSKNSFKVIVPGGVWNNLTYSVSGVPTFKKGEDIVLMVRKNSFGYYLPDLALSKFTLKIKEGKKILVSEIFAEEDGVGKINYEDFSQLAQEVYGQPLVVYEADKFVYKSTVKKKEAKRTIASAEEESLAVQEERDSSWRYFWLIVGFAAVGSMGSWLSRRTRG